MMGRIKFITTPDGLAKVCRKCGRTKALELFVKDDRCAGGRGQPCSECKAKQNASGDNAPAKKAAKAITQKPAKKPAVTGIQQLREAGIRGGVARAAKDAKANTHPLPQTADQRSQLLYAKAGKALREAWKRVDPERYEQEIKKLTNCFPGKNATDHQHKLFHAYCEGVIKRYGG